MKMNTDTEKKDTVAFFFLWHIYVGPIVNNKLLKTARIYDLLI